MDGGRSLSAPLKIGDRLLAAAQVAGVLATGWFVWVSAVLPQLGLQSLASIAFEALIYVTFAWICGGIATFCVYFVVSLGDMPRITGFSMRTSAPAMWFAPAIVLMSTRFAAAFAVSFFLMANATRHLVARWTAMESPYPPLAPACAEMPEMFRAADCEDAFLSWDSIPVLMGSGTAQAGLVALLWRHPFLAAALFAVSTAILTSLSISSGACRPGRPPALPHSALSVVWTFLLAAALTFGGISFHGRGGAGPPGDSDSTGGAQSGTQTFTPVAAPPDGSAGLGGDFPGVILLPELRPNTTIFVPYHSPPVRFGLPLVKPVGIPFSGEYWMYRWPARRPPPRSVIRRGSASEISFHTTDGAPLDMEAHQKLEPPVSMQCCSRIQVYIYNADPYPGTVALELILLDNAAGAGPPLSLGTATLGHGPHGEQVLGFPFPPVSTLRKFDEVKIVFHRDPSRADKSARVSIERFVLAP